MESASDNQWEIEPLPIHGHRIVDESGKVIVDDIYDEQIAAEIVREHNAHSALSWLATVVYLHYHNRTDLNPIEAKHLELAIRARGLVEQQSTESD